MNREQFQIHWPIMEAFKNGRAIESRMSDSGVWTECSHPSFLTDAQYRIKKTPFTVETFPTKLLGQVCDDDCYEYDIRYLFNDGVVLRRNTVEHIVHFVELMNYKVDGFPLAKNYWSK
jgi:hypothetical protein